MTAKRYIPTRDEVVARLREQFPWAGENAIQGLADDKHARNERDKALRPLTLHEVAQRWYSYEKVITAMHAVVRGFEFYAVDVARILRASPQRISAPGSSAAIHLPRSSQ